MTKQFLLAIIIVNYKTPKMVIDVLESLSGEIDKRMKVIIVDNDSQDDSAEKIQTWIDSHSKSGLYQLIQAEKNTGFSSGNNVGIRATSAEYYLLLNSDTIVREGAINHLLLAAVQYPAAGLIGPRLEWSDGISQQSCFHYHSPLSEFLRAASIGFISKAFDKYIVARPVSDSVQEYQWISFACVMVRAEVFEQVGLLDDKFFMYFEDVEFSYRAAKAGWGVIYEPNSHVIHLRGGTSPLKTQARLRKRLPRYFYESRTRYFYLLYGHIGLLAANLLWMFGASISALRSSLFKSHKSNTVQYQWKDTWINFLKPLTPYIHPKDYD